ncbi:MAG: hypothetical protein LBH92_03105 [Bacteroidales bacterium]|jgi:hypothetical protein|nr:hypothetical protein [Bacteroidales bacterium]
MRIEKNYCFFLIAISVILGISGCEKNNPKPTPKPIDPNEVPTVLIGTWKQTAFDGQMILTDDTKIFEFYTKPDTEGNYPGNGVVSEKSVGVNSEPIWQEILSKYTYRDSVITITGTTNNPFKTFVYTYRITELTDSKLDMTLSDKYINGNYYPDNTIGKNVVFEKVAANTSGKIAKMWKEKSKNGTMEQKFGLYFNLNTFDYYYYDDNEIPHIKNDHQGSYWFYDNFFVLRYFDDPDTGDQQYHVDCWDVELEERDNQRTMTLNASRGGGVREAYVFTHFDKP